MKKKFKVENLDCAHCAAKMEDAIKKMVVALLDNRQIMTIRYDEPGCCIVTIEFNPDQQEWGCHYPYWLSPAEEESVVWDDTEATDD